MVKINDITDPDSRDALMRLFEMGVVPYQLFLTESKPKMDKKQFFEKNPIYYGSPKCNFIFIEMNKEVNCKVISLKFFDYLKKMYYENNQCSTNKLYNLDKEQFGNIKIVKMRQIDNNNLKVLTNTNQIINIKYTISNKDISTEESNTIEIENCSSKFSNSYKINNFDSPITVNDNLSIIYKGGFLDGRIEINSLQNEDKEKYISNIVFNSVGGNITAMEISKDEKCLICGTDKGFILRFKINKNELELKNYISLDTEEIVSLSLNDALNMVAASSRDGYVNLLTLPNLKVVRSIYISTSFKYETEILYAENVFLSSSPLPCVTVYIANKFLLKTYTINGNLMENVEIKEHNKLISPYVFSDLDFQDYLIYGLDSGVVKIRKLPGLELAHSFNPFKEENKKIGCLCLSKDQKSCFVWETSSNKILLISN
jgi:hypothetical protein